MMHMRKSRFRDHQILGILKAAEAGTSLPALCREHGICRETLYTIRGRGCVASAHTCSYEPPRR